MTGRPTPPPRAEAGYSLIEVLAASTLLAGVLISIMTMFVYGGQNINSGKLMTKATSITTDSLEEFRRMNYVQCYEILEDMRNDADSQYEWRSDEFGPNAPLDGGAFDLVLEEWKADVEQELPEGRMVITVKGLAGLGADPTAEAFIDADVLQVVVSVEWRDKRRERSVVFQILKV